MKRKITSISYTFQRMMLGSLLIASMLFYLGCSPKTADKTASNTTEPKVEETKKPSAKDVVSAVDTSKPKAIEDRYFSLSEKVPVDPNIRMGTLSNGMKYYIRANKKPENRMELRLAVNAGSMQEDENQRGLAHFVEHMAFNGTKNFKKNELVDYLESIGTKFGPDLNAYTSFDETVYMLQIPTEDKEIMDKGLLIMEDWASNISFSEKEIDKERGVVLSEWRTGLGAQERMRNKWFPVVFHGSRYAERLPIGDPSIVENADYETIRSFYKKWYRPDLMAISMVGDFNPAQMEKEIKERFGKLKNPETSIKREVYQVPDHASPLVAITKDKEATSTAIQILYKQPHQKVETVEDFRRMLIYDMYNGILNQRLSERTREAEPPYIYAYSGYSNFVRSKDAYFSYALVGDNGLEKGLKAVLIENEKVKTYGFTLNEFARQKAEIKKSVDNAFKEKDKTPSSRYVMNYVYNFLENTPITGIEYKKLLTEQLLETIDVSEVNKFAHRWLTKENQAIVVTMPDKEGLKVPTEPEILGWINETVGKKYEPYLEEEEIETLMSIPSSRNRLYGKKTIDEVGVTEITFPQGIKIILKQTDFKNDEVLMTAFRKGGLSQFEDKDYVHAAFADNMIAESGVSEYTASQLEKYFATKSASFYPYMTELYEGFKGQTSKDDIEILFQMMYLYFSEPAYDIDATSSFIKRQTAQMKNQSASPRFHFYDKYYDILYKGHPRQKLMTDADFENFDTKKSALMFRDRFRFANGFTIVFVGSFDMEKMTNLIEYYVTAFPKDKTSAVKPFWVDRNIDKVDTKVEETIYKGQEPQSIVALDFHGKIDGKPQSIYDLKSMVSVLSIMLREQMREEQGGVYGVRVSPSVTREPDTTFSVGISFLCAPDDVEKLTKTVFEQIKELQTKGPSLENLTKVQETQRREREKQLKENGFWLSQLTSSYKYGSNPEQINYYSAAYIETIDAVNIQNAAKTTFDLDKFVKVVLMPEK